MKKVKKKEKMEKPTCGNCPYWEPPILSRDVSDEEGLMHIERISPVRYGICCRFPNLDTVYRESHKVCGEHPMFKQWMAEQGIK